MHDQYDYALSTPSSTARDAYVLGLHRMLGAEPGVGEALTAATEADPDFALAHIALVRHFQVMGDGAAARTALAKAEASPRPVTARERGHIEIVSLLVRGKVPDAYAAARAHLQDHPRDVLIALACIGVFSLIGFSGRPGREAENLALAESIAPHYGDDWWMQAVLGFAQVEVGQLSQAEKNITRSLATHPRNAHGAHIQAHYYYETGQTEAGLAYLTDWQAGYDRAGLLHGHIAWHIALWTLAGGDQEAVWQLVDRDISPESSSGPPLNIATDMAAVLYRAELAGVAVPPARWQGISTYVLAQFPNPGLGFVDVHAALAHAMAGRADELQRIVRDAKGPMVDLVRWLAEAFGAIAAQDWAAADSFLVKALSDHARLGGSRAQRDLIEYASVCVLVRMGRHAEARRQLAIRRPLTATDHAVAGI